MTTLIAYASKYGSTEKCAKTIAIKISGAVDLCNLKSETPKDLSQYDKVIIGSSIYVGKAQKEVTQFCLDNVDLLRQKKLGLYICCMFTEERALLQLNNAFPKELLDIAATKEIFGGEFNISSMKYTDKFIVKMVGKVDKSLPAIDLSEDISTISNQVIDRFTELIN
ncbi:MAG: flavodoxin domain-containing protein [Bacillota bacterium]|nr:flavodoxin domain-containing protein [Bacillota bacterium]